MRNILKLPVAVLFVPFWKDEVFIFIRFSGALVRGADQAGV